jgi:hypothetical protein
MGKYPYYITNDKGKKFKISGTRCLKINDIHQHIRVVSMLDKLGLDFDVISVVLDKYRKRLTELPKPLMKLDLYKNFFPRNDTRCKRPNIIWLEEKFRNIRRIEVLNHMLENSKTDKTTTQSWRLDTPLHVLPNMVGTWRIDIPPIPFGFKGTVAENIKLIERLCLTEQRENTNHFCVHNKIGWCGTYDHRKFIDSKKLNKSN